MGNLQNGHFPGENHDFPARCAVASARKGEVVHAREQVQDESPARIARGDPCAPVPADADIFNFILDSSKNKWTG